MKITIEIKNCLECPYLKISDICEHPTRKLPGYVARCDSITSIINTKTGFPAYCPLLKEVENRGEE